MAKKLDKFPQIVIANRLDDGLVVWLGRAGIWTGLEMPPLVVSDEAALREALSNAQKAEQDNLILAPTAIAVSDDLVPELAKHKILLSGPTVRRDLGWQAQTFERKVNVPV